MSARPGSPVAAPSSVDAIFREALRAACNGDPSRAAALFEAVSELDPGNPGAHCNRGVALAELGQLDAALDSYDRAIRCKADHALAHAHRGEVLMRLNRPLEALASFEQAIALNLDLAEVHSNVGVIHKDLKRFDAALASFNRAIALKPDHAPAYYNRGTVQRELGDHVAALDSFDRVIALDCQSADAYVNRAQALLALERHEDAIDSIDRALALGCTASGLLGLRQIAQMRLCEWADFDTAVGAIADAIERGEAAASPFCVFAICDSAHLHRQTAENWIRDRHPLDPCLGEAAPRSIDGRIRVGYFSADFHNHATMALMAGLFESHDRDRFDVTAFSYGTPTRDAMRRRLEAASTVLDVHGQSDREIARLARKLRIDIAVDLKGLTEHARPGIFALRAAPLQVGYLGHPGTMGAQYMDYLVADRVVIPPGYEHHYREKIIYLPESYQVNDGQRRMSEPTGSREQAGLPPQGMVYCCFNNTYKITPRVFTTWMRMLERVPDSVLWLLEDHARAANQLRQAAVRAGIGAQRLIFAPRLYASAHLARHRFADLFLDTSPCNAHTTASDALWAGLPVLTCPGEAFASRVAASLLSALGLPELITVDRTAYEEVGVALGLDAPRLTAIKRKLAEQRRTGSLFDTVRTTRHLEAAYAAIHARARIGLPPEHVVVEPLPAPPAEAGRA